MNLGVIFLRIGIAVAIGTVIGIEREYKNRPAGMRTHVLVCLGACIIALIEDCLRYDMLQYAGQGQITFTVGRICAQVVSGIGFLGAGTIFMAENKIAGLTTAASLWNAACLGIAVGLGYFYVAIIGCACVMIVLMILQQVVHVNPYKKLEVKFVNRQETLGIIEAYFRSQQIVMVSLDLHMETHHAESLYTNTYTLKIPPKMPYSEIINHLSEYQNIRSIRVTNI